MRCLTVDNLVAGWKGAMFLHDLPDDGQLKDGRLAGASRGTHHDWGISIHHLESMFIC